MQQSRLALAPEDVAALRDLTARSLVGPLIVFFVLATAVLAAVLAVVNRATSDLGIVDARWWPYPTIAGVVGLVLLVRARSRAAHADLRAGEAVAATYEIRRALRFAALEGEGDAFVIEDADGEVHLVTGQELPVTFPAERLVVPRAASGTALPLKVSGRPVSWTVATMPLAESELARRYDVADLHRQTVARLDEPFDEILELTPHE